MSRRRPSRQDSLELLLDTICNTFGGVLFIAILVVLLLQQTGAGPATELTKPIPVSPLEMQTLTLRMDAVISEMARLQQNRDSQQAIVQTFAPESIRALLAARREVNARQADLQREADQLLANQATLVARVESLTDENALTREHLDAAKSRLQTAQVRLAQARQSRVENIRLPVIRSASQYQEIGLILRYGRMYVWHKYGPGQQRLGLNLDEFVVVGEEDGGLVTRPKPTAGVALDSSQTSQERVRQVLRQFNPQTCYLVVIARPDSYAEFKYVRDRAIELGFDYRLMPADTNAPICDRGGKGGSVQ